MHTKKTDGRPSDDRFFDDAAWKLFDSPQSWKFISPFQERSHHPSADGHAFQRWMKRHPHAHPFYEVLLVISGSGWYGVDRSVFRCGPGSMVVIGPNQPHACRYRACDDRWKHVWVSFITPEQAFVQFVVVRHGHVHCLQNGRCMIDVSSLSRLLHMLHALKTVDTPTRTVQSRLLLTAFFGELIHLICETGYRSCAGIDRDGLAKKITIICEHIRKTGDFKATLADWASVAGYTPGHFAKLFKQTTGHTIHQHIDACRIAKVQEMLAKRIPLKTMATALGFSDKTTLSRWLNKYRRVLGK